ncbi:MAG: hypothetical protein JXN60_07060, partial [Lentisphaerae bacterium]|nr:hypothetical protein [Lentisphaerota bacterium]
MKLLKDSAMANSCGEMMADNVSSQKTLTFKAHRRRWGLCGLFCTLLVAGGGVFHPVEYDNTASRYYMVSSLVDFGTWNIDRYHETTIDKSFYDGHYYSNKGVGTALLGVPVYWMVRHTSAGSSQPALSQMSRYWVRLITTTVPYALVAVIMFGLASRLGASPSRSVAMALAYGLGTPAWIHASLYSGHLITGMCVFGAFAIITSSVRGKASRGKEKIMFLCAGFLSGWAVLTDYPAVLLVGILVVYAFVSRWGKSAPWWFIVGGSPTIIILMMYNHLCFGNPLNLSYGCQSLPQFSQDAMVGLYGVRWPNPVSLLKLLFSPSRGILLISPVLLLTASGLRGMWVRGLRRESVTIGVATTIYLLFNAGYVQWHGGWIFGPRYLTPVLVLASFPIAFARFRTSLWLCLLLVSTFQVGAAVLGMPHTPPVVVNPVRELILPLMADGYTAINAAMRLGLRGPA